MSHTLISRPHRILAGLIALACAFGLMLHASPAADAMTTTEKKAYIQALAAQEKLSFDVLSELAALHDSSFLELMAEAEKRDLERVREMLRIHGWKDRTAGDQPGDFRCWECAAASRDGIRHATSLGCCQIWSDRLRGGLRRFERRGAAAGGVCHCLRASRCQRGAGGGLLPRRRRRGSIAQGHRQGDRDHGDRAELGSDDRPVADG